MKSLKTVLALLLVFAMVLSFAACAGKPADSTNTTPNDSTAASYKSQIVIARPEDSDNLDPVTQDGNVNIWVLGLVMEGLIELDPETMEPKCDLAESYTVSDDYLTYTFKIRDGLKFSNGDPVLGEDFVWSYERALFTEESVWTELVAQIDSVEAPDDTTFIIHMKNACPFAETTFSLFTVTIGDKSFFEEVGAAKYGQGPRGTGPYMVTSWEQGVSLTVTKNPNYRDADSVMTDSIKFNAVPDDNTRIMQLENGDVDAVTFVPWSYIEELENRDNTQVITNKSTEVRAIFLNCWRGPTADVRVRQALYKATSLESINSVVLYGHGTIADSFLSPALPFYKSVPTLGHDVEEAKKLMAEAGYGDGITLTFTIVSGNSVAEQIATLLQQQWAEIGVDLKIETLEAGTHNAKRNANECDLYFGGWTSDILDPSQEASYWCNPALCDCINTCWDNPRAAELEALTEVEMDPAKRAEYYAELQEIYAEEVPAIVMYYAPFAVATSKKVSGFTQLPNGTYVFDKLVAEQ